VVIVDAAVDDPKLIKLLDGADGAGLLKLVPRNTCNLVMPLNPRWTSVMRLRHCRGGNQLGLRRRAVEQLDQLRIIDCCVHNDHRTPALREGGAKVSRNVGRCF